MYEENKFSYRSLNQSKEKEWHFARGLNDITTAGNYAVRLYHEDLEAIGISTAECDTEHYVVAHLVVIESAATGKQQKMRTVGQTLMFTTCANQSMKIITRICVLTPDGVVWHPWVDSNAGTDYLPTAQELNTTVGHLDNKFVYKGTNDVDIVSGGYFDKTVNDITLNLKKWGDTTGLGRARHTIAAATEAMAGVMSAEDKKKLNKAEVVTNVEWGVNSNINDYTSAGVYYITGKRSMSDDGLPIDTYPYFTAKLLVVGSTANCKSITQILSLNASGKSNLFLRTCVLGDTPVWSKWSILQQNTNVGRVDSLDNFTAGGVYSGIYTGGTSHETFVLTVINNETAASAANSVCCISQFKYALDLHSNYSYKTRTGRGTDEIEWGDWADLGAPATENIKDGAVTAQKLSDEVREMVEKPLRPLYIAAGAAYNAETGLYSLNGVNDLTEEQISLSYAFKDVVYRLNVPRVLQNISIRAIFPHRATTQVSQIFKNTPFNGTGSLGSTKIEIFKTVIGINDINSIELDKMLPCEQNSIWAATFYNCTKLREIWPINTGVVTRIADDTFLNCSSLAELRLYSLKCNLPIQYSPLLSKNSVLYIIKYATPASAITITLHPDAYARLADDAEIVAALEAQPLVSLVSA